MYFINSYLKLLCKTVFRSAPPCTHLLRKISTSHLNCCPTALKRQLKSHSCGKLRKDDIGEKVRLRGFLQYQRMKFIFVLRDAYGKIQVVIDKENKKFLEIIDNIRFESYLEIIGTIAARPEGQANPKMETGEIEVVAEKINILNPLTCNLPFLIRDFNCPLETLALNNRHLDLRHRNFQENLRYRSKVAKKMRDYLQDIEDFVEVTTPILSVNTPGGAQEFVVPSRLPGKFYSLVQSPQLYKQLLMIGGMEKYFQFAPCFRDEGGKLDRQPEFTQLDIEMSDPTKEEIKQLMENIVIHSWMDSNPPSPGFPSLTYKEAMEKYGTDKPDTSFKWMLRDVTTILAKDSSSVLLEPKTENVAIAFMVPQGALHIKPKEVRQFEAEIATEGVSGLLKFDLNFSYSLKGKMSRHLTEDVIKGLIEKFSANVDDTIILLIGEKEKVFKAMGRIRLNAANHLENSGVKVRDEDQFHFLWVEDFPLFEKDNGTDKLVSCHHPFTRPHEDDIELLYEDPLQARSQHYDLVLNGNEIAGGSIRIHEAQMQSYILESILKIDYSNLAFLLQGLNYGAPPHGGIALGFDRYISILKKCKSIRDVIAFPKTSEGKCYLTGAPKEISEEERKLYHIHTIHNDK